MSVDQVFDCDNGNNLKKLFGKSNQETLFIRIENDKLSGKGYIFNSEGQNKYLGDFMYKVSDVQKIYADTYNGSRSLFMHAIQRNLYGQKKVIVVLPKLKDMDYAMSLMRQANFKVDAEGTGDGQEASFDDIKHPAFSPGPKSMPKPAAQPEQEAQQPEQKPESEQPQQPESQKQSSQQKPEPEQPQQQVKTTPVVVAALQTDSKSDGKPDPLPIQQTIQQPVQQQPVQQSPAQQQGSQSATEEENVVEEFRKKIDKLTVLKECGMLEEKEYQTKRTELVSGYCGLAALNEKIEKLNHLKECGILSDKEYETNRSNTIREYCDVDAADIDEYKKGIQKLSILELGGVVTIEEFEQNRQWLIDDVEFNLNDDKEKFAKRLKRLPVLRDVGIIKEKEYKRRISLMCRMVEPGTKDEPMDLADKLNKWPILVAADLITNAELEEKKSTFVNAYLGGGWNTQEELDLLVKKMLALRDCDWLTDDGYASRKNEIINKINGMKDQEAVVKIYMMCVNDGFISQADYNAWRQKCIDDIFRPCESMDEFKHRVSSLLDFQKLGMITEDEFAEYKSKLMSNL